MEINAWELAEDVLIRQPLARCFVLRQVGTELPENASSYRKRWVVLPRDIIDREGVLALWRGVPLFIAKNLLIRWYYANFALSRIPVESEEVNVGEEEQEEQEQQEEEAGGEENEHDDHHTRQRQDSIVSPPLKPWKVIGKELLLSIADGIIIAAVTVPIDYVWTKLACDVGSGQEVPPNTTLGRMGLWFPTQRRYNGVTDVCRETLSENGVLGFYRAFPSAVVGVILSRAITKIITERLWVGAPDFTPSPWNLIGDAFGETVGRRLIARDQTHLINIQSTSSTSYSAVSAPASTSASAPASSTCRGARNDNYTPTSSLAMMREVVVKEGVITIFRGYEGAVLCVLVGGMLLYKGNRALFQRD